MSPNSELHGVAVGILNDSANDPYRAESSGGQKKLSPTVYCVAPWGLFLLLTSGSGRLNFCRYWRSSVGWILCWDYVDADDYVADVSVVPLVLTAGLYWCKVWNWHIFPLLSLIIVAIWRYFNFTIYYLKQIHSMPDHKLYDLTLSNVLLPHRTAPWTKLTKYIPTDHFVPSNLRHIQYGNQFWFSVIYVI